MRIGIYTLEGAGHACRVLRIDAPLGRAGHELVPAVTLYDGGGSGHVDNTVVDHVDLAVVQRFFPSEATAEVIEALLASGKPVVYETDDPLHDLPTDHKLRPISDAARPHILELARRADAIFVSTPRLGEIYAAYNPTVRVLPNLVDTDAFYPVSRASALGRGRIRVGYAGTPSHEADLEALEPALLAMVEAFGDRIELVFMGCATRALLEVPGTQFQPLELDYATYAHALSKAAIDVAVAPIGTGAFDACKSDVKWLEYGACGIAGVFSDAGPYARSVEHGETGLLASSPQDFIDGLGSLISDDRLRRHVASRARERVVSTASLRARGDVHAAAYARLLAAPARHGAARVPRRAPARRAPSASIIIPTYDRVDLLEGCLRALLDTTDRDAVEIIVVDNGSQDATPALIERSGSAVRGLRSPENLGFAGGCNRGAAMARAPNLLFLNNDTIPQPGFLEPLLEEVAADPLVGVVGSQLLYPSGDVQHAGVLLGQPQAVPYHPFRGGDRRLAAVNRRRELQAVTAACMLVRRALFVALRGFDEAYRNGFEDIDLCLRVRERGEKVIYQPRSVVVHLEEQTAGRKAHDAQNLQRFLDVWRGRAFPDEVGFMAAEGWVMSTSPDAKNFLPAVDDLSRELAANVAGLERRLREGGLAEARAHPPVPEEWPDDPCELAFGREVCLQAGLSELAAAFDRRLAELLRGRAAPSANEPSVAPPRPRR